MGKLFYWLRNVTLCQALGPRGFFRCHKSFLLPLWVKHAFSESRDTNEDYFVYLKMGRLALLCKVASELLWVKHHCRHLLLGQNNISNIPNTLVRHPYVFFIYSIETPKVPYFLHNFAPILTPHEIW